MKRNILIALTFLATAGYAVAQIGAAPTSDVLGAHLNYGRGCAGCHAPHSGAAGNGGVASTTGSGVVALWGQDATPILGMVMTMGDKGSTRNYNETLPTSLTATTPDVKDTLLCLSCHDGNLTSVAMMKDEVYEKPTGSNYNSITIPTLLGKDGTYNNDHPVGLKAAFSCAAPYNWDCTLTPGVSGGAATIVPGPNMTKFIGNYGFFVALDNNAGTPVVDCTTCHNQHVMNVVSVNNNAATVTAGTTNIAGGGYSGLTAGYYTTMFFIRAPYNPNTTTPGSNQDTQFCRQCHGGESNEMNNATVSTVF